MSGNSTIKVQIHLFPKCARSKQEGDFTMVTPNGRTKGHFDHLDEIPAKIRKHLEQAGLVYDIADDSDETVIEPKRRKRRVVRKIRLGQDEPLKPK